jgi:hypothetical protein
MVEPWVSENVEEPWMTIHYVSGYVVARFTGLQCRILCYVVSSVMGKVGVSLTSIEAPTMMTYPTKPIPSLTHYLLPSIDTCMCMFARVASGRMSKSKN